MSIRAVFDCRVFLQAAASPTGPAMACFSRLEETGGSLCISRDILAEVGEVLLRPELQSKFKRLTPQRVAEFLDGVKARATLLDTVRSALQLHRDPKDEPYLNLAIEAKADYLVTWNARHLTYLMDADTPEGVEFTAKYASLRIVDPVQFLRSIAPPQAPQSQS
jgi:putative PIN family toxin of toxin-antitoxin system